MDACFMTSQPFVIDNTNPTKLERQKYISIAKENKFKIIGFYFQSKILMSLEKNKQRQGRDFIKEIGIKGTFNKLQVPTIDEGFDELFYVEIENNNFLIKEWTNEI